MSCSARDPYNNHPEARAATLAARAAEQQYQQQPQQWGGQRSNAMGGRPASTPTGGAPQLPSGGQHPGSQGQDLQTENFMLRSDLNEAVQYIYRLGGTWPPS